MSSIVKDVSKAICEHLVPNAIKFPQTAAEFDDLCQAQNETRYPLPGVFGAIDGTHIRIVAPQDYQLQHLNYKGFYSLQFMGIVDFRGRFMAFDFGLLGSCHDSYVMKSSQFFCRCERRKCFWECMD